MPAEAPGSPFRVGVNYWPARTAMAWWSRFDLGEVIRDFEGIAASGIDSVRVFLLWECFQPEPGRVDRDALRRLVDVADAASSAGLGLMPTLFTGHMSGVNWIPDWALGGTERDDRFRVVSRGRVVEGGLRNWYIDDEMVLAQTLLATEAAASLAGHDALWAWDLGNEPSNCVVPPDREHARRWLGRVASAIRDADATAAVTIGLHMEDLEQDRSLGPLEAAEACDMLTMHGYPIYASWADGPTDEHLVPFLAGVTRWLGGGADVLFSEFGLPTAEPDGVAPGSMLVSETDAARYTGRVLDGVYEAGCTGAMVWCHTDYVADVWTEPPLDLATHERSFGLWRADGSQKPALAEVTVRVGRSRLDPPDDDWLDLDHDSYWREPRDSLARLYRRYRERIVTVQG